jgi:hypothetical protein
VPDPAVYPISFALDNFDLFIEILKGYGLNYIFAKLEEDYI